MVFGKKDKRLTEEVEKKDKKISKDKRTLKEETKTPRMDYGWMGLGWIMIVPLMVITASRVAFPYDMTTRLLIVVPYCFLYGFAMMMMNQAGLNERNIYKFYPLVHLDHQEITDFKTHKVLSSALLNETEYETPEDFDKAIKEAYKEKVKEGFHDGDGIMEPLVYGMKTDKPENDFILVTPGIELDVAIPLKRGDCQGNWSTGIGNKAAPSYVAPLLAPLRRIADGKYIPVWYLLGGEGIFRRYGTAIDLASILSYEQLVAMHDTFLKEQAEYFKNIAVSAELRANEMKKVVEKQSKDLLSDAEDVAGVILGAFGKAKSKGLPGGRDWGDLLAGSKLKKAVWVVMACVLLGLAAYFWIIGPLFFPMR